MTGICGSCGEQLTGDSLRYWLFHRCAPAAALELERRRLLRALRYRRGWLELVQLGDAVQALARAAGGTPIGKLGPGWVDKVEPTPRRRRVVRR